MKFFFFKPIFLIVIVAFIIRIANINFPFFTSDEARLAWRGYVLATSGQDELGRSFPLIFNSLEDYQLPATSYITALGILLFGKSDFGARIPFIFISVLIVVLIYKISTIFSIKKEFGLYGALLIAFSPPFIFLSKIPNEVIVLIFALLLIFYLLTRQRINFLQLGLTMAFALTISKLAWWILIPFSVFTYVFFQTDLYKKTLIKIMVIAVFLTLIAVTLFLRIPQSSRSLLENDFSIFKESGITVVIDRLRGEGLVSSWPPVLERLLFNKLQIATVGFLHWLTNLQLGVLFGQFDADGTTGFTGMGAFSKIAIIPFILGIVVSIRKGDRKFKALILYFLILTFPIIFMYPRNQPNIIVTTLPYLTIIAVLGLVNLNRFLKYLILFLMVFEVSINIFFLSPEIKKVSQFRPGWIKQIVEEGYHLSKETKVAVSDNLVLDIAPFWGWLSPLPPSNDIKNIQFPYKVRQTQLANLRIIGSDDTFYNCGLDQPTYIFASKRDLKEIKRWLNIDTTKTVKKVYKDNLEQEVVYFLKPTICVH